MRLRPSADTVALLVNPTNPTPKQLSTSRRPRRDSLALTFRILHASTEREIDAVFAALGSTASGALFDRRRRILQ